MRRDSVQNTAILQNSKEQMKCKASPNSFITLLVPKVILLNYDRSSAPLGAFFYV